MTDDVAIGVDIGAGSIKSGVYTRSGNELSKLKIPMPSQVTNESFMDSIYSAVSPLLEKYSPTGIGFGSPGPLDNKTGVLISSANMPNLRNVEITKLVSEKFGLKVYYDNDANCAALAEAAFGNYKDCSSLLILTLGSGIGGGFVENKNLFNGYKGNGIEIGHMTAVIGGAICGCGQRGCVEAYFSTNGFLNRYHEVKNVFLSDAEEFFSLVRRFDLTAVEILKYGTLCLAETIRGAVHLLNPEAIIFVGGITAAWDLYGIALENSIRSRIFPVLNARLKIGVGQNLSGSLGAASLVFNGEINK